MAWFTVRPQAAFLQPPAERPSIGPAAVTKDICSILQSAREERLTKTQIDRVLRDGVDEADFEQLQACDLRAVLLEPSTWIARQAIGLREKAPSKKRPQGGVFPNRSQITSDLKRNWNRVKQGKESESLCHSYRDNAKIKAESYETRAADYAEAAILYREVMVWSRELEGEDCRNFVKSCMSYIRCVGKARYSSRSSELQREALRLSVKLYRMYETTDPARITSASLRGELGIFLKKTMNEGFFHRFIANVSNELSEEKTPFCTDHGYVLHMWHKMLQEEGIWHGISEEEHQRRQEIHERMLRFLNIADSKIVRLPALPKYVVDDAIASKFIQDLSKDSDVEESSQDVKAMIDFVIGRRGRLEDKIRYGTTAATLLLMGPPATGKTATARRIAKNLNVPLIKIDGSHIKSKWYGESANALKSLIAQTITHAKRENLPNIVIMFDEIDGIATARKPKGNGSSGGDRDILMELLNVIGPEQLHYTFKDKDGKLQSGEVIIVAASNRANDIDDAMIKRFNFRISMPRWTPLENLKLLRSALSEFQPSRQAPGLFAFGSSNLFSHRLVKFLTLMAVSRMDLRMLSLVIDRQELFLKSDTQNTWGQKSWNLFAMLRQARISTRKNDEGLIENASYAFLHNTLKQSAEIDADIPVKIVSHRVSLAPLLSGQDQILDLSVHPYVTYFDMEGAPCMFIVHQLGVTIVFLGNAACDSSLSNPFIFGCYSGKSFSENLQKVLNMESLPVGHLLSGYLETHEILSRHIHASEQSRQQKSPESIITGNDAHEVLKTSWPTFLWSEIVPGCETFQSARDLLKDTRSDGEAISLEVFTSANV